MLYIEYDNHTSQVVQLLAHSDIEFVLKTQLSNQAELLFSYRHGAARESYVPTVFLLSLCPCIQTSWNPPLYPNDCQLEQTFWANGSKKEE